MKPPRPERRARPARLSTTADQGAPNDEPRSLGGETKAAELSPVAASASRGDVAAVAAQQPFKPVTLEAFKEFLEELDQFAKTPDAGSAKFLVDTVATIAVFQPHHAALETAINEAGNDPTSLRLAIEPLRKAATPVMDLLAFRSKFLDAPSLAEKEPLVSQLMALMDACVAKPYPSAYETKRAAVKGDVTAAKRVQIEARQKNETKLYLTEELVKDLAELCELALRENQQRSAGPSYEGKDVQSPGSRGRRLDPGASGTRASSVERRGSGIITAAATKRQSFFGQDPVNARFEREVGIPLSQHFVDAHHAAQGTDAERQFLFLMALHQFLANPDAAGARGLVTIFIAKGARLALAMEEQVRTELLQRVSEAGEDAVELVKAFKPLRAPVQQAILDAGLHTRSPNAAWADAKKPHGPRAEYDDFSRRLRTPLWRNQLEELAGPLLFEENVKFMLLFDRFFDPTTTDADRAALYKRIADTHFSQRRITLAIEFGLDRASVAQGVLKAAQHRTEGDAIALDSPLAQALWRFGIDIVKCYIDGQVAEHPDAFQEIPVESPSHGRGSSIGRRFLAARAARQEPPLGPLPERFSAISPGSRWFNHIRDFAKEGKTERDFEFLEVVDKFLRQPVPDSNSKAAERERYKGEAKMIRETYLVKGSAKELNLDAILRQAVDDAWAAAAGAEPKFDDFRRELENARDVVVGLVDKNQYYRFKLSPRPEQLLAADAERLKK
ncbi:hypothetical protein [Ramlibacter albus]|uniref:RGS domain-containing protein n=1 Tax=Ramlibacter albus TaxID=2079448 RepID=A0A923M552_9BURK|nr:hypothetical protein [Ramlibacter albus]MBC5764382.1 hypothetical protein [Ramlibacter albus]